MTIELTDDEAQLLTIALGIALGHSVKEKKYALSRNLFRLANSVHKNNPRWIPYAIAEEAAEEN